MKLEQDGTLEHLRGGRHRVHIALYLDDAEAWIWEQVLRGTLPGPLSLQAKLWRSWDWRIQVSGSEWQPLSGGPGMEHWSPPGEER